MENTHNTNAKTLLDNIVLWCSNTYGIDDITCQQEDFKLMFRAFLCSDFANNLDFRNSALLLYDNLGKLFKLLNAHSQQDMHVLLKSATLKKQKS